MKKVKKVLICAAAVATACSFTALTACKDSAPSDKLSADVTVAETLSAEAIDEQITKFENNTVTSVTVNGGLVLTKVGDTTLADKDKVTMANLSLKGNLADGDADALLQINKILLNSANQGGTTPLADSVESGITGSDTESGSTGSDTESGGTAEQSDLAELHVYLRGWKAFYQNEPDAKAYEYQDLLADLTATADVGLDEFLVTAGQGIMQDNETLLKIANATDSITVSESEHTITLNINKMVYGLYGYLKQIMNNLTVNTSISGLMQCSAVKYYVEAFTAGMTAQDLFDAVMEAVISGSNGGGATLTATAAEALVPESVKPLEGESVYNYIVRLLKSQDVADLIGAEKPLGATKISEILGNEVEQALNMIKQMVNSLDGTVLSENAITVPSEAGMQSALAGASVSNLTIVYTFDELNVLQSVGLSGNVGVVAEQKPCELELTVNMAISSQAVTGLEQIGSYVVNIRDAYDVITGTTTVDEILNPKPAE